ncbi:MAG TPA: helix-turn-helix transcriptional regulator [Hanamia sp.]|nr:helix-turn-helix transcriptional regulator [Hanamia sp.]
MKIGENIKRLRESQGKSPQFIADALNIDVNEYLKFENDPNGLTVKQLETISNSLSVSIIDLVEDETSIGQIKNYFYNQAENHGINIHVQGIDQEEIRKSYRELYAEELNRIPKLEKLLRQNNIEFNF